MSCCGKSRVQPFIVPQARPTRLVPLARQASALTPKSTGAVTFQYVGKTRLTVIGPISRQRYDFDRSGVRVSVDPRDGVALATVPTLKRV